MLQKLLRKLLGYKEFDAEVWWGKQRAKYYDSWLKSNSRTVTEAEDEYNYRSKELVQVSARTTMLVSLGGIILAACVFFFQGGNIVVVIASKLSAVATGIAMVLSLMAYMPRLDVLVKDFMPPEVWASLIKTDFDVYVKHIVRTARKTRPLDRYKRLHAIAIRCLIGRDRVGRGGVYLPVVPKFGWGVAHRRPTRQSMHAILTSSTGQTVDTPPLLCYDERRILRPYRLVVRTSPSHGGNSGSSPGRVTKLQLPTRKSNNLFCRMYLRHLHKTEFNSRQVEMAMTEKPPTGNVKSRWSRSAQSKHARACVQFYHALCQLFRSHILKVNLHRSFIYGVHKFHSFF